MEMRAKVICTDSGTMEGVPWAALWVLEEGVDDVRPQRISAVSDIVAEAVTLHWGEVFVGQVTFQDRSARQSANRMQLKSFKLVSSPPPVPAAVAKS